MLAGRPSRWIGLGLLLICLAVQAGLGDGLAPPWRRLWFDSLQQMAPRERAEDPPAVIIAIDEGSIRAFGQWPWPRDNIAYLISKLREAGVRAIGVDILFSEPDRMSPLALSQWLGEVDPTLGAQIAELGDTDTVLAETIRSAHVILPIAGITKDVPASRNNLGLAPAVVMEGVDAAKLSAFADGLRATPRLQQAAEGQAAIAFDGLPDGVVRRVPAIQVIGDQPAAILGAETLRVAEGAFFTSVTPKGSGLNVDLETQSFPTEEDGSFWLHFGWVEENDPRYIPAGKVMAGDVGAEALRGKIALLAVTGFGTVDSQTTPLAQEVWGIEAHLQMIEQIVDQRFLRRPFGMFLAETALLGLMGIVLVQLIPRAPPVVSLAIGATGAIALLGISFVAFQAGWLFDASAPVLGSGLTGAGLIALGLVERDQERKSEMRARELMLEAATAMQRSVLPAQVFEEPRVRLAAHLTPSFEVGGDLYDHAMLDENRLFFLVGDVSGKGIAACQFMGISKRLWRITAEKLEQDIGGIQTTANTQIAQDNSEMMFVTGIAAILDLATGTLSYSSAGHDQPILLSQGQAPRQLDEFTGPAAGIMAGMDYPVGETRMQPGDRLVMFSDGISEALDAKREAYGIDRLIAFLESAPPDTSPAELIDLILADVSGFVAGAEQSDDLTLMVVELST
ncbi:MAG: SpoIIE family protein phosphatase [Pseudomonadota bacterium]